MANCNSVIGVLDLAESLRGAAHFAMEAGVVGGQGPLRFEALYTDEALVLLALDLRVPGCNVSTQSAHRLEVSVAEAAAQWSEPSFLNGFLIASRCRRCSASGFHSFWCTASFSSWLLFH